MKKILVLGSEGQIGKPLVRHLTECGFIVDGVDILNSSGLDLRLQTSEIIDKFTNTDFIVFLAYDVGGSRYLAEYQKTTDFLDNNLLIMFNVFSLIQKLNKKFLFASSQMSNMSHSPYGSLKALGEHYARSLNGIIIKFWNVFGYETEIEKAHVITDFVDAALIKQEIRMLTSGQESREFLYVQDCVEAIEIIIDSYDNLSREETYDITSFAENTILEVAQIIADFTGAKVFPGESPDRVQNNTRNAPNNAISKYWAPKVVLRDGIKLVIDESERNLESRKISRGE